MIQFPEANAIVYCGKAFNTTNGKTAHGLVRFTKRYKVLCVVDSNYEGKDAGEILDGKSAGIPVVASIEKALQYKIEHGLPELSCIVILVTDRSRSQQRPQIQVQSVFNHDAQHS